MPQFVPVEELFQGRHFDREIVILCVRWYLSFKLSYRDLVTMMGERGIGMATLRFCGGSSMTRPNSRNAGNGTPVRLVDPGAWTKPTSE